MSTPLVLLVAVVAPARFAVRSAPAGGSRTEPGA